MEEFKKEQDDKYPKIVIIYSYHSPSDKLTQGLIKLKDDLKVPGGAMLILSYSEPFEHELTNRRALLAAGFIIQRFASQNANNKSKNKNKNNSNNSNNSKQKSESKAKGILQ